jgi:hypothetical protein
MVKVSLECIFPRVICKDGVGFNPLAQIAPARNCSIRFILDCRLRSVRTSVGEVFIGMDELIVLAR